MGGGGGKSDGDKYSYDTFLDEIAGKLVKLIEDHGKGDLDEIRSFLGNNDDLKGKINPKLLTEEKAEQVDLEKRSSVNREEGDEGVNDPDNIEKAEMEPDPETLNPLETPETPETPSTEGARHDAEDTA